MSWAYLTWFPEYGMEKVHEESRGLFEVGVQGLVVQVVDSGNDWAEIIFAEHTAKVRPSLLKECPAPEFVYGQKVKTIAPRSPKEGEVRGIRWHFESAQPCYLLSINGKKSKSRYWANELTAA